MKNKHANFFELTNAFWEMNALQHFISSQTQLFFYFLQFVLNHPAYYIELDSAKLDYEKFSCDYFCISTVESNVGSKVVSKVGYNVGSKVESNHYNTKTKTKNKNLNSLIITPRENEKIFLSLEEISEELHADSRWLATIENWGPRIKNSSKGNSAENRRISYRTSGPRNSRESAGRHPRQHQSASTRLAPPPSHRAAPAQPHLPAFSSSSTEATIGDFLANPDIILDRHIIRLSQNSILLVD